MKSIIINADDFGKSKEINHSIMAAMDANLCMDTTLLVNFEDSAQAAELAISCNRKNNVGIHLNLTEGSPLTNGIKNEELFCNEEGLFDNKKKKRIISLSNTEKKAVLEELTSQIKLYKSFGIPVSHADSHNHIHEEPGLFLLFMRILKNENIPFLRLTNNIGKTKLINRLYRNSYNYILKLNKLTGTDYFGSTSELINSKKVFRNDSSVELMIHPGQIRDNHIFDIYSNEDLSLLLPEAMVGYKLTSYHQLSNLK